MPAWKSWNEIEQLSKKEQRTYLQQALQNREPIKKFSDIKRADHLVRKGFMCGKAYDHHFLCVESISESGRLTIIHYFNTPSVASFRCILTSSFSSGAKSGQVARVQEVTLPHEDFIKSESDLQKKGAEVERVVWPKELRRYSVDEIIRRARYRKNETYYDVVTNNCESFVMWSMCNINFSLQSATTPVMTVFAFFKGVIMSFFQLCRNLPKISVEIVERALNCSCLGNAIESQGIESLSMIGCTAGLAVALVLDVACLALSIWRAKKQWDKGILIRTRHEFIKEVVHAVILHFVRFGAGAVGFFIGQIFLPIPFVGGIVGGFVGSAIGHWLGKCISHARSEAIAFALEAWYCYIIRIIFPRVSPTQEATDLYRNFLSLPAHT